MPEYEPKKKKKERQRKDPTIHCVQGMETPSHNYTSDIEAFVNLSRSAKYKDKEKHCFMTAVMKLKDTCSWKGKL